MDMPDGFSFIKQTPFRKRAMHSALSFCVLLIMARDFARQFYNTQAWHNARNGYMQKVRGLCEICLAKGLIVPAEIVHHKIELTPENITDSSISLDYGNLQALCRACHAEQHEHNYFEKELHNKRRKRRWMFNKKTGEFLEISPP